jgi:hypothetical protein
MEATASERATLDAVAELLSSSSSNILLLCGGLYDELYERPYNKILSSDRWPSSRPSSSGCWVRRGKYRVMWSLMQLGPAAPLAPLS